MKPNWDISDFNDKGELKTPVSLVLALLYLSRHIVFLLLGGLSHFVASGSGFRASAIGLPPLWALAAGFPVFLFLILIARKEKLPKGGLLKRLFYHGAPLLVFLGVLQLLLIAGLDYRLLLKPDLLRAVDFVLLGGCVYYLATNAKLQWFFREYGDEPDLKGD